MLPQTTAITDLLATRIALLDGAMGTQIQAAQPTADDFGGEQFFGCNEQLNLTRPDLIEKIHAEYLAAGADIIETNSFGATPLVLDDFGLGARAAEINAAAVAIARRAVAKFGQPRFIAGSVGPTTRSLTLTGGSSFAELQDNFRVQLSALAEAGVDLLIFETTQDILNLRAALAAYRQIGLALPIIISFTVELSGTLLAGQTVEAALAAIEYAAPLAVGLNCATGPAELSSHLRRLSERAPFFTSVLPNAGLPDEHGHYSESPADFAREMRRFIDSGWVNLVGGCCGTTPAHIAELRKILDNSRPRRPAAPHDSLWLSGLDFVELDSRSQLPDPSCEIPDPRPISSESISSSDPLATRNSQLASHNSLLVGERTNSIGSKKFRDLIAAGDYEAAAELGRAQIESGAQILDLCTANPDRDELTDFLAVLTQLVKKVKAPLMLDTTDARVLAAALPLVPGKCLINSINLENGEKRFAEIVPLAREYGAAFVVGLIDEEGMAVTCERKLAIAERSHALLTTKFGVPETDIVFDPLVFPVGTGDAAFLGSAPETFAALAEITKKFPRCATTLGISNCSFGLPPAGREVVNAVYLYQATRAGLQLPIVNTERLRRYATIPESERALAEELIATGSSAATTAFVAHFRTQPIFSAAAPTDTLPPAEQVQRNLLIGSKTGLVPALDSLLATHSALTIVNEVLLTGMAEVGRLFGENQLIVAEVLQSAEVMKAAVDHLRPHLAHDEQARRGKLLLATVKGDVHDIGKNLVEIIFANNGFEVVNLGIKVDSPTLIAAAREHTPDLIGLSGLLIRSAHEMAATAADLRAAGITTPLLVGGAALSEAFVRSRIAPEYAPTTVAYARDAMAGLRIAGEILSGSSPAATAPRSIAQSPAEAPAAARSEITIQSFQAPTPPSFTRQFFTPELPAVYDRLDRQMLFGKHLGFVGHFERALTRGDAKARALADEFAALQKEIAAESLLTPQAVWQFFRARRVSDTGIILLDEREQTLASFDFPRRPSTGLTLADFVSRQSDVVALFVATAGVRAGSVAQDWKVRGDYLRSHFLAALALETAESTAELTHAAIRRAWGLGSEAGARASFGYPACPELADQAQLFALLDPSTIGVTLTDGFMMQPEASVSALVLAHPQTREIFGN